MFSVPQHLLWEYDLSTFDYAASWRLVIERVIQRGNIAQWRAAQIFYGKDKFEAVIKSSKQLSERDRNFASLYIQSSLNDSYERTDYQAGNLPTLEEATRRLQAK